MSSQEDLDGLLTRQRPSGEFSAEGLLKFMQVVPGIPEDGRYGDPKFKPVRDAFTANCLRSARAYRDFSVQLFRSFELGTPASVKPISNSLPTFDSDCLVPLAAVPESVRRVVGILLNSEGDGFCTATIVGPRAIITSRHCFVRAEDGVAEATRSQAFYEQISLQTLVPHGNRDKFSIASPASDALPLVKVSPADDYIVLYVKSWELQYHADLVEAPPTSEQLPIAAWIVGSNPTLADVGHPRTALDYARGSAPKSCSILEATPQGCLYHSCQTGPATSGAGILLVDDGKPVRLVGVHKGPLASANGCEAAPPLTEKLNLATAIRAGTIREQ